MGRAELLSPHRGDDQDQDQSEQGDRVVTSELGELFPQGLLVGTVSKVYQDQRGMFQEIEVEPAIDFSRLENVIIIMKKNLPAE